MADALRDRMQGISFDERLKNPGRVMGAAARRVIDFIESNRAKALASSALEIAASTETSDATVVRTVQALGFAGLGDFKQALAETIGQTSTPADDMRRTLAEIGESTGNALDSVLDAHDEALTVLRSAQTKVQIAAAVMALHPAARIVVFGVGPSAALASYASILLGRSGRRTLALNQTGIMLADQMLDLGPRDAVLILAYSRVYREVSALFLEARRLRLRVVLITDGLESKLARFADVVVAIPRGRAERVALHGATLVALEALVLGLAANSGNGAMATLERLNALRNAVNGQQSDLR